MTLTKERLLLDLYVAFYDARKHKSSRSYVRKWEKNLKENMERLCEDLVSRTYKPLSSKCFIVDYPKKREIFAAMFRDRIVHHLYFNYTHLLYERTFIQDSYSCINGRGTHYGIQRVTDMIRRESRNWRRPCYAMHLDIRGYFMHIDRKILFKIAVSSLQKMSSHVITKGCSETWADILDMDFLYWLTEVIVLLDPKKGCVIAGEPSDWIGLDPQKSMLNLQEGLGLPIGNLTSQLFSNVYLNLFDQFVKRELKCKNYGRYVDDGLIIHHDKEQMLALITPIRDFLKKELGLELHMGKLTVSNTNKGVEFLGVYIKPWRTYISRDTLSRISKRIMLMDMKKASKVVLSVNSYLGILRHAHSYRLRRRLFLKSEFLRMGVFDADITKMTYKRKYKY